MASQGGGGNAWESMAAVLGDLAASVGQTVSSNQANWTGSAAEAAWADFSKIRRYAIFGQDIFGEIGNNISQVVGMESFAEQMAQAAGDIDQKIVAKIKLASVPLS